jgi:hypothetical protein
MGDQQSLTGLTTTSRATSIARSSSTALLMLPDDDFTKPLTLQEAKSIARHLGFTLRKVCSGHYRVNFRDANETTACYADNLEDAANTAVEMARKRAL